MKLALIGLLLLGGTAQSALADVQCNLTTFEGETFYGFGYDQGSALAQARDACIAEENNSRECVNAPFVCREDDNDDEESC